MFANIFQTKQNKYVIRTCVEKIYIYAKKQSDGYTYQKLVGNKNHTKSYKIYQIKR